MTVLLLYLLLYSTTTTTALAFCNHRLTTTSSFNNVKRRLILHQSASSTQEESTTTNNNKFELDTALFSAGLAFDAYVEPPQDSSRWERGSRGMNVAFVSGAFTRNLYKGVLQVTPIRVTDLPDEDDTVEAVVSGGGTDAALAVAVLEGDVWRDDITMLETRQYHEGVRSLTGAAHVGRSTTAWSNINEAKSRAEKQKTGIAPAYHVPSTWGKGGQAIWTEDERPFYLYLQDPKNVRLVFTIIDDDVMGNGDVIGSAHKPLKELIPQAAMSSEALIETLKQEYIKKQQNDNVDDIDANFADMMDEALQWEGSLKCTSKPRLDNKNGQIGLGVAAGAMVAGPVGAAVGGMAASFYEGQVRGSIQLKLKYLPILQTAAPVPVNPYTVKGGMPGIDWGELYRKYVQKNYYQNDEQEQEQDEKQEQEQEVDVSSTKLFHDKQLEHCFFINHEITGGCCAVYRSLESKLVVVSFRGTCVPKDLLTDGNLAQVAWIQGQNIDDQNIPKVHSGFWTSMNSISRRLKELLLATADDISECDVIVTGHSLGGALATLFVADVGEFGIDAGRALPQLEPSEPWWKAVANTFTGNQVKQQPQSQEPPRPKSLKLYNFGSPRVGNEIFAANFDAMVKDGRITQAYRIVNGEDVIARNPRTINALVFGKVNYEHVGATVLVRPPLQEIDDENDEKKEDPLIWIEGESDDNACPVRDGKPLTSPLAEGSLLGDLLEAAKTNNEQQNQQQGWQEMASKLKQRLSSVSYTDLTSVVGIDKSFTEREVKMIESIFNGEALSHHMEDQYYGAMGRACGFVASVGEDIEEVPC